MFKGTNKVTWIYDSNFITQCSATCFGYSFVHLQGDEKKNKNTIKVCINHSIVVNRTIFS